MRHAKRFVPALVVAFVLSGTAVSQALIVCTVPCPVWDFTAILRVAALNGIKEAINEVAQKQAETLYKMAWRLQQFVPLGRYEIHPDDRPEWRIFDWFSDSVLVAKPFHHALSYGDATGEGFDAVSLERPDPADVLDGLSPEGASTLRNRMALIDLHDSAIIRGTHEAGLIRYNGRATQGAVDDFQHDVLKDDNEESATAVLDKISAARLLHLRDQQARMNLRQTELELALIDNIGQRDAADAWMDGVLHRKRDAGRTANALVGGRPDFTNGGQP
jgi:hypothetical protein